MYNWNPLRYNDIWSISSWLIWERLQHSHVFDSTRDLNRQQCHLSICSYFGWVWQIWQIWDEQACLDLNCCQGWTPSELNTITSAIQTDVYMSRKPKVQSRALENLALSMLWKTWKHVISRKVFEINTPTLTTNDFDFDVKVKVKAKFVSWQAVFGCGRVVYFAYQFMLKSCFLGFQTTMSLWGLWPLDPWYTSGWCKKLLHTSHLEPYF